MDILITGVGGQGTLLASRVLGKYALDNDFDCKLSEVHGMSQRGGSVITFVRIGDNIASPLIEEGGADIILAFEKLEALRYAHYLKKGGFFARDHAHARRNRRLRLSDRHRRTPAGKLQSHRRARSRRKSGQLQGGQLGHPRRFYQDHGIVLRQDESGFDGLNPGKADRDQRQSL